MLVCEKIYFLMQILLNSYLMENRQSSVIILDGAEHILKGGIDRKPVKSTFDLEKTRRNYGANCCGIFCCEYGTI